MMEIAKRRSWRERSASFPSSSSREPLQITTTNSTRRPIKSAITLQSRDSVQGALVQGALRFPGTKIQHFVADEVPKVRVVSPSECNQPVTTSFVGNGHVSDDEHKHLISQTVHSNMGAVAGQEEHLETTSSHLGLANLGDGEDDTTVSSRKPDDRRGRGIPQVSSGNAVSYTHLTLPTIYSV